MNEGKRRGKWMHFYVKRYFRNSKKGAYVIKFFVKMVDVKRVLIDTFIISLKVMNFDRMEVYVGRHSYYREAN